MTHDEIYRSLGRLEGGVAGLQSSLSRLEVLVEAQTNRITNLETDSARKTTILAGVVTLLTVGLTALIKDFFLS